jgi:hypothetical protein
MFWLLAYVRDAIDFEWLFGAAGLLNVNNAHPSFTPRQYSAENTKLAENILYMIKIRLVFAAEVVFVYMVDGQREPFRGMKFPANYKSIGAVAESWKECVESFRAISAEMGQDFNVPLEEWPVRAGYDEKVVLYETKFMAEAE